MLSPLFFQFKRKSSIWQPSWISYHIDFSYFCSTNHLNTANEVLSLLAICLKIKMLQNRFSTWLLGRPFWIFDLQITLILPIKFQVNWPFCSEAVQNRFSRRPLWGPISYQNNFSFFIYKSARYTLPSFE